MSAWAPKRFWTAATAAPAEGGYTVLLDGRSTRTPAKAPLVVPSLALAEAMAGEWQAQEGAVDPRTMPLTRAANAAIDKVTPQFAEVAEMIAAYGDADLLCYRAEEPEALVARQAAAWDPLLDWAAAVLGAPLEVTRGVMHHPQPPASLRALSERVHALDAFSLTSFHDLVSLSGSLVIGFSVIEGRSDAAASWPISRIDEDWQQEVWGIDEEAAEMAETKRQAFMNAEKFFLLSRG